MNISNFKKIDELIRKAAGNPARQAELRLYKSLMVRKAQRQLPKKKV